MTIVDLRSCCRKPDFVYTIALDVEWFLAKQSFNPIDKYLHYTEKA